MTRLAWPLGCGHLPTGMWAVQVFSVARVVSGLLEEIPRQVWNDIFVDILFFPISANSAPLRLNFPFPNNNLRRNQLD